jgi:protein-S-isoprenylcysteine O-methyltransferase Ste14
MSRSKLNVTPTVRPGAQLVERGPYRWIRHPMYTALLLGGLGLVWNAPSPLRWAAWIMLALVLLVKLHYEEGLLATAFTDYPAYQTRTKRLIPYLY